MYINDFRKKNKARRTIMRIFNTLKTRYRELRTAPAPGDGGGGGGGGGVMAEGIVITVHRAAPMDINNKPEVINFGYSIIIYTCAQ